MDLQDVSARVFPVLFRFDEFRIFETFFNQSQWGLCVYLLLFLLHNKDLFTYSGSRHISVISHSSKRIQVFKLSFCQNDPPIGGSLWQKDSLITHMLFELWLITLLLLSRFFWIRRYKIIYLQTISKWGKEVWTCLHWSAWQKWPTDRKRLYYPHLSYRAEIKRKIIISVSSICTIWVFPVYYTSIKKNTESSVIFLRNGVLILNGKENKQATAICFEIRNSKKENKELLRRVPWKIYGNNLIMDTNRKYFWFVDISKYHIGTKEL